MSAGKLSRANSMAPDDTTVASSSVAAAPADGDNVRVGVRIRPSIQTEKDTEVAFLVEDEQVKQMGRNGGAVKFWPFDYVFGSESSTKDVYMAMAKGIVETSLLGYNGVVFAYGQTASGTLKLCLQLQLRVRLFCAECSWVTTRAALQAKRSLCSAMNNTLVLCP